MLQYPGVNIVQGQSAQSQISSYPDTQCIVVYNESPFFLQVNLNGSGVYGLAAYTADCFQVFSGFSGGVTFNPTQYIAITNGTPPASIAFIQAYGSQEPLTKLLKANQATGYPISLNRLQNIGNMVNTNVSTASEIVNTTNSALSPWLNVRANDTTNPVWNADNSGNLSVFGDNAGVLTLIFQLIGSVANPSMKLPGGVSVTTSGGVGTLNFTTGTLTKIASFGAYNLNTTLTAFNHNLGVVPDLILLQVVKGVTLGYAWYEDSTMTTTQVNLAANAASVFVRGLAIKF